MSDGVTKVLAYANDGITFVFGSLSDPSAPTGSIIAIQTFAAIIFVSALFNVLYYFGILMTESEIMVVLVSGMGRMSCGTECC